LYLVPYSYRLSPILYIEFQILTLNTFVLRT
jgi:hypothetical protein